MHVMYAFYVLALYLFIKQGGVMLHYIFLNNKIIKN